MAKRKKKAPRPEYSILGVRVTNFDVYLDSGISYEVRDEKERRDDMQVYSHSTHIELTGTCTYPEDREGHTFAFSIYSGTRYEEDAKVLVRDYRAYDERYQPISKKVRGREIPVYNIPRGIGYLQKRRGENVWQSAMFIERQATSDMLVLLGNVEPLYVSVHEMKLGRKRSIVGFTLQTTDPADE